jgi:hypothetical protein
MSAAARAGRPVAVVLWIAFAVLVAAVLWVVLAACGLAWPGGRPMLVFCPLGVAARPVDPALGAEQERQRALQRRVRDLEIALLERPYCAPPEEPQAQAQLEPEPVPAPPPEPEPEPPSIEDTIRQGDVEALEGCWEQASDLTLQVMRTGELISVRIWEVCFADDGQGRQSMEFTSGVRCHGGVNAGFPDDGTLQIDDTDHMRCDNGSYNVASTTMCTLAGETAQCVRRDQDNPENASSVTLRRTGR